MKKITLILVAMFGMATVASAQYTGHKFFDNWSIGVEGGTSTNLCDWDTPNGGVAGINLTKGITPVLSLEFQLQAGFADNANWNWSMKNNITGNIVNNATFMANTKINLMNWFCGYKGTPRLFEIQARGGVGYTRFFFPSLGDDGDAIAGYRLETNDGMDLNRCVFKFGFDFDFNLGKQKEWTISLRPAVILKTTRDNDPAGETFRDPRTGFGFVRVQCDNDATNRSYWHNCLGQITAGVTYHFKTSNGTHHFAEVKPVEVTKVVEKVVEKPVEKVVEKVVEKGVAGVTVVEFGQNKDKLTDTAKAKLNAISKDAVVCIDGYASPEGNKAYNQKLSQRRCDVVKAYLQGRGVKIADVNAHGVAGPESQRIVYVTVK